MKCSRCGKEFDYPPAQSRKDGRDLCRICSATEAISFLPKDEQREILDIIRDHENGQELENDYLAEK